MKYLSGKQLTENLKSLFKTERKTTAEIIEHIKEIDRRRLYLEMGFSSTFAYLTEEIGYGKASAQRRIDAARMTALIPEIHEDLKNGKLNLTQVSLIAQGLRQKEKEVGQRLNVEFKKDLIEKIKSAGRDLAPQVLAQALDLELNVQEKIRPQKDESVRLEVTLSKKQMEKLGRVKELISHTNPNPSLAELIELLADKFIERKDPRAEPKRKVSLKTKAPLKTDFAAEHLKASQETGSDGELKKVSKAIPRELQRSLHRQEQCCQWTQPVTGRKCGSRFRLQIDHQQPRWAGGDNSPQNLRILCAGHNLYKFRREAGLHPY